MGAFEITVLRKADGALSKRITLTKSGKVKSDGSTCRMARGRARRVKLKDVAELAELIEPMGSSEALALGRLRAGLPDKVRVIRKDELDDATPAGTIARDADHIVFAPGKPAFLLLDHDRKEMPREVRDKLKAAKGFWRAVVSAVPALADAARVERCSTSAGIFHKNTGEQFSTSRNRHVYVAAADGSDVERALKTLQDRLWLAGFGYVVVGAAGQILIRSIIDASVYGPERLVFEGQPVVEEPLAQDKEVRRPRAYTGNTIDTATAIPALTELEVGGLAELKAEAVRRAEPLVSVARKAWAEAFADRHGLSVKEAERIAGQATTKHILATEFELEFDDPDLGCCTVAEVIANPNRFVGEALADPLEGRGYGRGKAKVLRMHDRCLMINSFAHGGVKYQLAGQGTRLEDFRAYKPAHTYIFAPTCEPWPAVSVNSTIPPIPLVDAAGKPVLDAKGNQKMLSASEWLDRHRSVEQITWAPGREMDVEDWLVTEGGWVKRNGVTCFNLYIPPNVKPGDPNKAGPWIDHVHKVYPNDAEHIIQWLAHRVQHPDQKINHALVLGGPQGTGKDTLLEPAKYAVGPWNFREASPKQVMGRFNNFLKGTILRISEARDLGEYDRYAFYDHSKTYTAAPPDVLRVDEKHLREYSIFNVVGVIITTNHLTDGIYLAPDDRRHYVAWTDLTKESFGKDKDECKAYWDKLWRWYGKGGGRRHVAAHLAELDISKFGAKAPPPQTAAFHAIVNVGRAPEEAELADTLDLMGNPDAVTIAMLIEATAPEHFSFHEWLSDRKNRRSIPHRLDRCGYVQVNNNTAKDGYFVVDGERRVVYAKAQLPPQRQLQAARKLADGR